jgi:hypothetical protein
MKPAAAFSIGLWTGAAVIAAVGLFYVQGSERARTGVTSAVDSELAAKADEIRSLEQDNARLNAEVQRLKETTSTLKSNLAVRVTVEAPRRIPFARAPAPETVIADAATENWVEQAVAGADATALPQLEKLALRNNRHALEAVALLADRDQGATLTRVWRSGSLSLPSLVDATRYLAATMEINPDAEQLLRGLAADPNADPRVLYAAMDGVANPNFPVSFERDAAVPAPPHFKPDFAGRIRMLESLRSSFTDPDLRAYVDQAKAELQTRWAESNPTAP